jgi:hypothetical protein
MPVKVGVSIATRCERSRVGGLLSAHVGNIVLSTGYPPAYPRRWGKVVDKGVFALKREGYTTRVGQSGAKWGERDVPG